MKKILKWLTREREEMFYGMAILFAMVAIALNANGFHHPVHLEVDHIAMEKEYEHSIANSAKFNEQRKIDEDMKCFEECMEKYQREHEENVRHIERLEKEMEAEKQWQEKEDVRLKAWARENRERCFIPELDLR